MHGKSVLIVEDIIDTGLSMKEVFTYIESRGPVVVKTATFLDKPAARKVEFQAEYVGFSIEPQFVIGYGLDYAEKYRNLPDVQVLSD
jgi:hypoxanthine phosphoribosyltransferase